MSTQYASYPNSDLENPMVIGGDYYDEHCGGLPDTANNQLDYIRENSLGWLCVAIGLHVEPDSRKDLRDQLEYTWEIYLDEHREIAAEWAEELVNTQPYCGEYTRWRRNGGA